MKTGTHSRFTNALSVIALTCGLLAGAVSPAPARTDQDLIEVARSVHQTDRHAIVVATVQLADGENKDFWPLYHEYRFEIDKDNYGITRAADLFRPIFDATNGVDGWVSLEVSPLLAYDASSTQASAS
jgi:hypothetical protein